jgi:hypothetical protein
VESNCCLTVIPLPVVDAVDPVAVVPEPADVENLETTAQAINLTITQGEQSLATAYWELGDTLLQLRPLYLRGTWEGNLSRLGIEQTRAKRALWFRRHYTLAQAEEVESPAKEFAARPRKQRQRRRKFAKPVFEDSTANQPVEEVSDEEFLAFNNFAKVCGSLERAMQVAESCCCICGEVACHE